MIKSVGFPVIGDQYGIAQPNFTKCALSRGGRTFTFGMTLLVDRVSTAVWAFDRLPAGGRKMMSGMGQTCCRS